MAGGRIRKAVQKVEYGPFIRLHYRNCFSAEELDISIGLRSPVTEQSNYSPVDLMKNTEL